MARIVSNGWASKHMDIRPGAAQVSLKDEALLQYAATMCGHVVRHCDPDCIDATVARFVAVNTQAYGISSVASTTAATSDPLSPLMSTEMLAKTYSLTRTMKELDADITMPTVATDGLR